MAIYRVTTLPLASTGTHPHEFARNAVRPSGADVRGAAEYLNFLQGHMLKRLFSKSITVSESLAGHTTATPTWRFRCHTSPNGTVVHARVVLYPAAPGSVGPAFTWTATNVGTGLTVTGSGFAYPGTEGGVEISAASDPAPGDMIAVTREFALSGDTTYEWVLNVSNGARVIAATLFEVPRPSLNTASNDCVDLGAFAQNLPITDAALGDMMLCLQSAYKRLGAHYVGWSMNATTPVTVTSATVQNILDTSVTTGSDNSPGFPVSTGYRGTHDSTNVPVVFAAYMKTSAGTATLTAKDQANTTLGTISTASTTEGWVTGTMNLTADTTRKIDIMASATGGGTVSVYAVSIYDYVA